MLERIKLADEHRQYDVHSAPKGIQRVHKDYGLWIISGGGNNTQVNSYYKCHKRYFEFYSISHMHSGAGCLWLSPGREIEVKPGQCIIICPGTVNRYGGYNGKVYDEDSLRFSGPVADTMRRAGIISDGVFDLGEARSLLPLIKMASDPAVDAQIEANIALQKFLFDIYTENRQQNIHGIELVMDKLIATVKEQSNRWWTVTEMADFCNLSDDQFRRVFRKRTGMLPKLYIDRLKIQKAAELLMSNRLKVIDIAERLGYVDQYHFSRCFKKLTGLSPRRYRQTFSSGN